MIRLSVWTSEHGRSENAIGRATVSKEAMNEPERATIFQDFAARFDATSIWEYKTPPANLAMSDIISEEVLRKILDNTGAHCRMDLNHNRIIIGAISEAKCDHAYRKLDIIRKYTV